jgi:hypothetical protein
MVRRSTGSLLKSSRLEMSVASLPISSQSSASVSSFSSYALRPSFLELRAFVVGESTIKKDHPQNQKGPLREQRDGKGPAPKFELGAAGL